MGKLPCCGQYLARRQLLDPTFISFQHILDELLRVETPKVDLIRFHFRQHKGFIFVLIESRIVTRRAVGNHSLIRNWLIVQVWNQIIPIGVVSKMRILFSWMLDPIDGYLLSRLSSGRIPWPLGAHVELFRVGGIQSGVVPS